MEPYDSGSTAGSNRLADVCVALLQRNRSTVMTAESCIGGMLPAKLVDIPGVPEVFQEGYITYSNKAKRCLLNISKTTLKKYGAVSTQTVWEMAIGAVLAASVDIAVLITGITGPDGGDDEKPVDPVFISCYMNDRVTVKEHRFQGDRTAVRIQAVQSALHLLRTIIFENTKA